MNTLTEPQKAYIAGIIDGEGCVTVGVSKNRQYKNSVSHSLRCIVASTDFPLMDWLQTTLGCGRVYKRYSRPGNLQGWNFVLTGSMAISLYNNILLYLIIKKEQVLLSLEMHEYMKAVTAHRLTQEQKDKRQEYADKIKALKYTAMVKN